MAAPHRAALALRGANLRRTSEQQSSPHPIPPSPSLKVNPAAAEKEEQNPARWGEDQTGQDRHWVTAHLGLVYPSEAERNGIEKSQGEGSGNSGSCGGSRGCRGSGNGEGGGEGGGGRDRGSMAPAHTRMRLYKDRLRCRDSGVT